MADDTRSVDGTSPWQDARPESSPQHDIQNRKDVQHQFTPRRDTRPSPVYDLGSQQNRFGCHAYASPTSSEERERLDEFDREMRDQIDWPDIAGYFQDGTPFYVDERGRRQAIPDRPKNMAMAGRYMPNEDKFDGMNCQFERDDYHNQYSESLRYSSGSRSMGGCLIDTIHQGAMSAILITLDDARSFPIHLGRSLQ
jgi:hypothetical protein